MASNLPRNSLTRTGSFGRTWRSSTNWKSEGHHKPPSLYDRFCTDARGMEPDSRVALPTLSASPSARHQSDLNKPLPPLPKNEQVSKWTADPTTANGTHKTSRRNTVDAAPTLSSKIATKLRRLLPGSTEVLSTDTKNELTVLESPETVVQFTMVDQGVQTSPIEKHMEPRPLSSDRNAKSDVHSKAAMRSAMQRTISTQKRLPQSPLRLQSNGAPDEADYFYLSSEADHCHKVNMRHSTKSDNVSPGQRRGGGSPQSAPLSKSPSSVSTYGSRYDERPEWMDQTMQRPPIGRSISDSTTKSSMSRPGMHNHSNSEHVSSTSSGARTLLVNSEETAKRLILGPRQGILPAGTASKRRSMGQSDSAASVVSPLRQEMILTPSAPTMYTAREKEIFRASVGEFSPSLDVQRTAFLVDIPDHLRSSPLCPLHPKYKFKDRGYCALHGGASLADESDESHAANDDLDQAITDNDEVVTPGPTSEGDKFNLKMPVHSRNSPECPANPKHVSGGKGVCIVHGRGRGRVAEV